MRELPNYPYRVTLTYTEPTNGEGGDADIVTMSMTIFAHDGEQAVEKAREWVHDMLANTDFSTLTTEVHELPRPQ